MLVYSSCMNVIHVNTTYSKMNLSNEMDGAILQLHMLRHAPPIIIAPVPCGNSWTSQELQQ
jgi:hypothetical protein